MQATSLMKVKLNDKVCRVFADKQCDLNPFLTVTIANMSFKTEMDIFFMRNCCLGDERSRIKDCRQYKIAEESNDIIHAQEIAMHVMEGKIANFKN
jgi:hypothetical protein